MAIAQNLKVATEVKDGTRSDQPVSNIALNTRSHRYRQNQSGYAAYVERYRRSEARCSRSETRSGRSKVSVTFYPYRVR